MPQLYMVRVDGREYGPIDPEGLRAWAREGRLVPENEVRVIENQNWFRAAALDRMFGETESEPTAGTVAPTFACEPLPVGTLLERTWSHYLRAAGTFFLIMLPVGVSGALFSVGADLMEPPPGPDGVPWRPGSSATASQLAGLVLAAGSFLLHLLAWPVCEAAVALGTRDLSEGRSVRAQPLLARAFRHRRELWTAALWSWATYAAWVLLGGLSAGLLTATLQHRTPELWKVGLVLLFGILVWKLTHLFVSFLFRAQATVFQGLGGRAAIRHSRELAHDRSGPFALRPLWGAASLYLVWMLLLLVVSLVTVIPLLALLIGGHLTELQQAGLPASVEGFNPAQLPFWPWRAANYLVQTTVQTLLQAYPIVGCTLLYLSRRHPTLDPALVHPEPDAPSEGSDSESGQ